MGNIIKATGAWFAVHRKFVTAGAAGALIVVADLTTGHALDWRAVVVAVLGSLGVYAVPNRTPGA